jgi:phosphatidylserine decarboxylase
LSEGKSHFPVAKEGVPFIVPLAGISILLWILGLPVPAGFLTLLTLFVLYFFRDPERSIPPNEKGILSPADGKIIQLEVCREERFLKGQAIKVSIFMSLFNVHVNRIPLKGKIVQRAYSAGKFMRANLDNASFQNEQNALLLETPGQVSLLFIQIAGLIARRIVCRVNPGDAVSRGERFGLIRFGSRLDVYMPSDTQVQVQLGQKVFGGKTILGILP